MQNISRRFNKLLDAYFPHIMLAFAAIAYLMYSDAKDKKKQEEFNSGLFSGGPSAQSFASRLHRAMNPSGYNWFKSFDTTDTEEVFAVFKEMKIAKVPFAHVAGYYEQQYGSSLTRDLENELSTEEFNRLSL